MRKDHPLLHFLQIRMDLEKNTYKKSLADQFLKRIPVLNSEKKKIILKKSEENAAPIEIVKEIGIDTSHITDDFPEEFEISNNDINSQKLFLLKLGCDIFALSSDESGQNPSQHILYIFKQFVKTKNFDLQFNDIISLLFITVSNEAIQNHKFLPDAVVYQQILNYLKNNSQLSAESAPTIILLFGKAQLLNDHKINNELAITALSLIENNCTCLTQDKYGTLIEILTPLFHEFNSSSLDLVAIISSKIDSPAAISIFTSIPQFISELIPENVFPENNIAESNSNQSFIPFNILPSPPFNLVENLTPLTDFFDKTILSKIDILCSCLIKTTAMMRNRFLESYLHLVKQRNSLDFICILIIIFMSIDSTPNVTISILMATNLFEQRCTVFGDKFKMDPKLNSARNMAFSIFGTEKTAMVTLAASSVESPELLAEHLMRIQLNPELDYSEFAEQNIFSSLLIGLKNSNSIENLEVRSVIFNFIFAVLDSLNGHQCFENEMLYMNLLPLINEECLSQKIIQIIRNYYYKNQKANLRFDRFYLTLDRPILNRVFHELVEVCDNNSINEIASNILDWIYIEFDKGLILDTIRYYSNRGTDLTDEEFNRIVLVLPKDNHISNALWEFAAGTHAIISKNQLTIQNPFVLPLLLLENLDIDFLFGLSKYSLINTLAMYQGEVDFLLLKALVSDEIKFRGTTLKIRIPPEKIDTVLKIIMQIDSYKTDSSICYQFIDIISSNTSQHSNQIARTFLKLLSNSLTIPRNTVSLGSVSFQILYKGFDASLIEKGFSVALRVFICKDSLWYNSESLLLYHLEDPNGNFLRVSLANENLVLVIKNGRQRLKAMLVLSIGCHGWTHIMVSFAPMANGLRCWPVINTELANSVEVEFKSAFTNPIKFMISGCDRIEQKAVAFASDITIFDRPITDIDCEELFLHPNGESLNPIFCSSLINKKEDVDFYDVHLMAKTMKLFYKNPDDLYNFFRKDNENADSESILNVLSLLHFAFKNNSPKSIFCRNYHPIMNIAVFLRNSNSLTIEIFRAVLALFDIASDKTTKTIIFDHIISCTDIWIRMNDLEAAQYFFELRTRVFPIHGEMFSEDILHTLSIAFYQEFCNRTVTKVKTRKNFKDLLETVSQIASEVNVSLWIAQLTTCDHTFVDDILDFLLGCRKDILENNIQRDSALCFLSKNLFSNVSTASRCIFLIHNFGGSEVIQNLLSASIQISSMESLPDLFEVLLKELPHYPNLYFMLSMIAYQIGGESLQLLSAMLQLMSTRPDFLRQLNLPSVWFIYPLLISITDSTKQIPCIKFIVSVVSQMEEPMECAELIQAVCEHFALIIPAAREVCLQIFTGLLKSKNPNIRNESIEYIVRSTLFRVSDSTANRSLSSLITDSAFNTSNSSLELSDSFETDYNSSFDFSKPENLISAIDKIPWAPLVFIIEIDDKGKWSDIDRAAKAVGLTKESDPYKEVIEYFIERSERPVQTPKKMFQTIEKRQTIETNRFNCICDNLKQKIHEMFDAAFDFIENAPRENYDELREIVSQSKLSKQPQYKPPPKYVRDSTLVAALYPLKMRLERPKIVREKLNMEISNSFRARLIRKHSKINIEFSIANSEFIIKTPSKIIHIHHSDLCYILMRSVRSVEFVCNSWKTFLIQFSKEDHMNALRPIQMSPVKPSTIVQKAITPEFFAGMGITQKWRKGLLSNFQYILRLNFLSGRSFKASIDYPVFPAVLSDVSVFKPAKSFSNSKEAERFIPNDDGEICERNLVGRSRVMPEFFFSPDFVTGDLPQWASSKQEFVYLHRALLESKEVTEWLPQWIDAQFGINQFAPAIFNEKHPSQKVEIDEDEGLTVFSDFEIQYGCIVNGSHISVDRHGAVFVNSTKIHELPLKTPMFAHTDNYLIVVDISQWHIWRISDTDVTERAFCYETNEIISVDNSILFRADPSSLAFMSLPDFSVHTFAHTSFKITAFTGNRCMRTVVTGSDDGSLEVYSMITRRLVRRSCLHSKVLKIIQTNVAGFIVAKTTCSVEVLSVDGCPIRSILTQRPILNWWTFVDNHGFDRVIAATGTDVVCFDAMYPDRVLRVDAQRASVIQATYDRSARNFRVLYSDGGIFVKHKVFDLPPIE